MPLQAATMYSIHSTWVQQVATPSQLSSDEDEYFVFMLVNAYILLVATLHEVRKSLITFKIINYLMYFYLIARVVFA